MSVEGEGVCVVGKSRTNDIAAGRKDGDRIVEGGRILSLTGRQINTQEEE